MVIVAHPSRRGIPSGLALTVCCIIEIVTIMPFNNVKLNYARLYGKELILREIVAEYKSRRWV